MAKTSPRTPSPLRNLRPSRSSRSTRASAAAAAAPPAPAAAPPAPAPAPVSASSSSSNPSVLILGEEDDLRGTLKPLGGSQSDSFNNMVAYGLLHTLVLRGLPPEEQNRQMVGALSALRGIAPRDELEGMMAAQLVATHLAAIECHRRAMLPDQPFEPRHANLVQATKLSRTYATLLEALNKHRGKGQQKVVVEHVHVHAGGKAVVGTVEAAPAPPQLTDQSRTLEPATLKGEVHQSEGGEEARDSAGDLSFEGPVSSDDTPSH